MAVIGTIKSITGQVFIKTADGAVRQTFPGDLVSMGDVIDAAAGTAVIVLNNGREITVGLGDELALDESVVGSLDELMALLDAESLQEALENGEQLDAQDEETEAGEETTGSLELSDFVLGSTDEGRVGSYLLPAGDEGNENDNDNDGAGGQGGNNNNNGATTGAAGGTGTTGGTDEPAEEEANAPVAGSDTISVAEDGSAVISVLANDTDLDGDSLSITGVSTPAHGTVTINTDGTITYTPTGDYNGADSFTYTITDGKGGTSTATVSIDVTPVNDGPVAVNDTVTVAEDGSAIISVLANDSDLDGDTVSVSDYAQPEHGTVVLNSDGTFTYTPTGDYNGADSFTYTITDGKGGTSTATVSIDVTPVNDGPVVDDVSYTTDEDTPITFTAAEILAGASDVDGDTVTLVSVNNVTGGTLTDNNDGTYTFTPAANFNGSVEFDITVTDGTEEASAKGTITVAGVNDGPTVDDVAYTTDEDTPITFTAAEILAGASDVDGDTVTLVSVNNVTGGTLTDNNDGTYTFTPAANFNGSVEFDITVTDGTEEASAKGTITVAGVNDGPTVDDVSYTTDEDTPITFTAAQILAGASDVDGDTVTLVSVDNVTGGTLTDNNDGTYTFTPAANFNGSVEFDITVTDGTEEASAKGTIVVAGVNDGPVAVNDTVTVAEDGSAIISVLANDSDLDGDTVSVSDYAQPEHGTVVLNTDGTFTYTSTGDYNGADSFTYTISDGKGGTSTATVSIDVTPVNDGPVVDDVAYTTDEDTSITFTAAQILAGASDVDGDTVTLVSVDNVTGGTLADNNDGTYTFTPAANFNGSVEFDITVTDGTEEASAKGTIVVAGVNDGPVVDDVAYTTDEDTPITFTAAQILAGASDVDGDTVTLVSVDNVTGGTLTDNNDGTYTFTPAANFNGSVEFDITVTDGTEEASAKGTITVVGVNDGPVAVNDTVTVAEDGSAIISVLANDTDLDGDTVSVDSFEQPEHGTVVLNSDGTFTYTPTGDYNGADSFTYTISDGKGGTSTATVSIDVTPVNDGPVAVNDTVTVAEDGSAIISVLANDSDLDGDTVSVSDYAQPEHGTVVLNSDGTFTYTPTGDYNGADSFTYTITDGKGGTSTATVSIDVTPVNDGPVAVNDTVTVAEDGSAIISVLANDSDLDGDTVSVSDYAQPEHGTVVLNSDGTFTYTPTGDYNGADSFTYTVTDGKGGTSTATVSIDVTPVNDGPVVDDVSYTTDEDTPITFTADQILAGASDVDGDTVTLVSVDNVTGGTLTDNNDGTYTFTPAANFNGSVEFDITVTDGTEEASAKGTITVVGVNDGPTVDDVAYTTDEDTSITFTAAEILAGASDVDGDTVTLVSVDNVTGGTLTDNNDGTYTFTPAANFNGSVEFDITVTDGTEEASAKGTITVVGVNDGPTVDDVAYTTDEDTPITFTAAEILAGASDIDGDTVTLVSVDNVTGGTLTDNNDGTYTFTPDADFNGSVEFDITVTDGTEEASAKGTITVVGVNDGPVAVNDTVTVAEDGSAIISVLANDSDLDGDTVSVSDYAQPEHGTVVLNTDGTFTYTPTGDYNGADSFTYTITDGKGGTSTATVSIDVTPVNDGPVAVNDTVTVAEDGSAIISVLANDTDLDGDTVSVSDYAQPEHGTVVLNTDGTFTYTPTGDYNGADSFTYTITDGKGGTSTATVSIDVTPVNDGPTISGNTVETDILLTGEGAGYHNAVGVYTTDENGNPVAGELFIINSDATTFNTVLETYQTEASNLKFFVITNVSNTFAGGEISFSIGTNGLPVLSVNGTAVSNNVYYSDTELNKDGINHFEVDENGSITVVGIEDLYNGGDKDYDDAVLKLVERESEATFTEDGDAVAISNNVTITDVDSENMQSLTVELTNMKDGDVLTVGDLPDGITYTVSDDGSTITFTGLASKEAYESAVEAVRFENTTEDPDTAVREFEITVTDDTGVVSNIGTLEVNVVPVNDGPVVDDVAYTTDEDTAITFTAAEILAGASDIDGDTVTLVSVDNVTGGTLTDNNDGTYTFTPAANFNGSVEFDITVTDGTEEASAKGTIVVAGVNDGPTVDDVAYTTDEDTPITFTAAQILAGASDVDGDTVTLVSVDNVTGGTLTDNNDGTYTFTPAANFNGSVEFDITVTDGTEEASAKGTIVVAGVNDGPVVDDVSYTTDEDTPITFTAAQILAGASDVDGDAVTLVSVDNVTGGTLTDNNDGTYTFTPAANFNGSVEFDITVTDGTEEASAKGTIVVAGVNDGPVAVNDTVTVAEDGSAIISVLANDSDLDGDTVSVDSFEQPEHGTVVLNTDGTFTYTPTGDYNGADSFTYTITDGKGGTSTATVSLNVTAVNDAPEASADTAESVDNGAVIINVLGNDTDVDGDSLTVASVEQPEHGTVVINSDGTVTYTPEEGYEGADSFTYTVSDGKGGTDTATVNMTVTQSNEAPVIYLNGGTAETVVLQESFESMYSGTGYTVVGQDSQLTGDHGTVWTFNSAGVEIQGGTTGGASASDGGYHAELDSHGNAANTVMSTTVNTAVSDTYTLTFDYMPRPGSETSSGMTVEFGDKSITITSDAAGNLTVIGSDGVAVSYTENSSGWNTFTLVFSGVDADTTTLTFKGEGSVNTLGAYLDDIKMTAAPIEAKENYSATAVADGTAVAIAAAALITDVDDMMVDSMTVTIKDALTGDSLNLDSVPDGISIVTDGTTITLTGHALLSDYQSIVNSITFSTTNSSADTRTIEVTVNDGELNSDTATTTIQVVDGNDAPVATDNTNEVTEAGAGVETIGAVVTIEKVTTGVNTDLDPDGMTFNNVTSKTTVSSNLNINCNCNSADLITIDSVTNGADVSINAQSGNDYISIGAIGYGSVININGADGTDILHLSSAVNGYVNFDGGNGRDVLLLGGSESDYTVRWITNNNGQISAELYDRNGGGTIIVNNIEEIRYGGLVSAETVYNVIVTPEEALSDSAVVVVTVENAELSAGTDNGDGTWTLTADELDGLQALPTGTVEPTASSVTVTDFVTTEGVTIAEGNVLTDNDGFGTDSDADGDTLTVSEVDGKAVADTGETEIEGEFGTLHINADGSYSYELNGENADVKDLDSGSTLADEFTYTVSDGTETAEAKLTITINGADSIEVTAADDSQAIYEGAETGGSVNLLFMLDISGSMNDAVGSTTRLELMKDALENLIEKYESDGTVSGIQIVTFSNDANALTSGGSVWLSVDQALDLIEDLSTVKYTDYDSALTTLMNTYSSSTPPAADNTYAYFLSDGAPTDYDGNNSNAISSSEQATWQNWLATTSISEVYAVGIGSGTDSSQLQMVAWSKDGSASANVITVTNEDELADKLVNLATVTEASSVEGNVFDNDDLDGLTAELSSVTYNGVVYTFDADTTEYDISLGDNGSVLIHADGSYTFTAGESVSSDVTSELQYTFEAAGEEHTANLNLTTLNAPIETIGTLADFDGSASVEAYKNSDYAGYDGLVENGTNADVTLNSDGSYGVDNLSSSSDNVSTVESNEAIRFDFGGEVTEAHFEISGATGSDTKYHLYDADGNDVGVGTVSVASDGTFGITSDTAFQHVVFDGGSDTCRIDVSFSVTAVGVEGDVDGNNVFALLDADASGLDFSNLDALQMSNSALEQRIELTAQDVLDMTDGDHTLQISGESDDTVVLSGDWTNNGANTYTNGEATVEIVNNENEHKIQVFDENGNTIG